MKTRSKFGSLMFRELRLTRKNTMLFATLLLAWVALLWGVLLSLDTNGIDPNELSADNLVLASALLGAVILFIDDLHHADIASGWITYSYALPITPFERAAVRFVRRFITGAASCLFSLIDSAAVCAYLGKPFGVNYILWHILAFSAVILYSLPDAFFRLRARSGIDAKKLRNVAGMASLAVVIISIFIIVMASGVDLQQLMTGEASVELPVFTAGAFLWALPLLLSLMAADFYVTYHSLRAAYPSTSKTRSAHERKAAYAVHGKTGTIAVPADTLQDEAYDVARGNADAVAETYAVTQGNADAAAETYAVAQGNADGLTGFLYKELAQNGMMLVLTAFVPLLLTALPLCFTAIEVMTGSQNAAHMFETAANEFVRIIMVIMGIFIVSGMMSEVFRGDDRKAWAYFAASTPQGIKGYLYNKYVVLLMMNLIYMTAGTFADTLFSTAYYFATGNEIMTSMSSLYLAGVFSIMLINAFDIPLTVYYGPKKGSLLKMTVMLALCAAAVFGFVMLPEPMQDRLIALISSILDGKADGVLLLILSICPYLCFGAFVYSYRISCRAFMKGVDAYDR